MRVLLAEDDKEVRQALLTALESEGVDCTAVATLRRASEELEFGSYDAVIADMNLPDGDGADLAALASARSLRAIIITGDLGAMRELDDKKITYLKKPFPTRDLLAQLNRAATPFKN